MGKMNEEERIELQTLTGRSVGPNNPSSTKCQIRRNERLTLIIILFSAMILGYSLLIFRTGNNDMTGYSQVAHDPTYTPKCRLIPEEKGPLPVILMALGRTGSSITWNTISRMTGFSNIAEEITGGNKNKTIEFFSNIDPEVGVHWANEEVCEEQHRVLKEMKKSGMGIAGFQWKPYRTSLRHELGDRAFDEIAAQSDPSIRIIFLTRNPLDRMLSNLKHKDYQYSDEVPPHCAIDDKECIKRHYQHQSAIVLPTGQELRHSLESNLALDNMVADKLSSSGVKHIHVTYENLFKEENSREWIRIFRFLGRGPQTELTMADVRRNFDLAPTSSVSHKDMITNFDDVWESLKGTKYENMVH